jgi:hypothetical protein
VARADRLRARRGHHRRGLYDHAWLAGFAAAFVVYATLMRGTPLVDLDAVPPLPVP